MFCSTVGHICFDSFTAGKRSGKDKRQKWKGGKRKSEKSDVEPPAKTKKED